MIVFFFSSRRRHTRLVSDWSSDVCSSDLFENNIDREGEQPVAKNGGEVRCERDLRLVPAFLGLGSAHQRIEPALKPVKIEPSRSEERRVGKECRSRRGGDG